MAKHFWKGQIGVILNHMVTENNFNRLAKAIMLFYDISYEAAIGRLESFQLQLICDESIHESASLQAALITAINSGRRAYHGGITVSLPGQVESLLPWPDKKTLNEIISEYENIHFDLAGQISPDNSSKLFFTNTCKTQNGLRVICDGWRGGTVPANEDINFCKKTDFTLGGVLAGGLAVSQAFLEISGLDPLAGHKTTGFSLWEPELNWLADNSAGPSLSYLPEKLWLIGLGHLGQAYLWTLGLLKHPTDHMPIFLLQDYETITEANWISGLLCEKADSGLKKTRLCANWLEKRGYQTTIVERAFDKNTHRTGNESFIALCGVDKVEPRRLLEDAGFDMVIESGLGGGVADFDRIIMHTFPNLAKPAIKTWENVIGITESPPHHRIKELTKNQNDCGILAETLANKAISTAFVGAVAASLVVGELLRALHGGKHIKVIHTKLRDIENARLTLSSSLYSSEMAKNGFITL